MRLWHQPKKKIKKKKNSKKKKKKKKKKNEHFFLCPTHKWFARRMSVEYEYVLTRNVQLLAKNEPLAFKDKDNRLKRPIMRDDLFS
jgi:hypothetical protein